MAETLNGVNGDIIRWAREFYNMTLDDAAHAIGVGGIIVTAEEYKPHSAQLPNVCEELDVKCISYDDFMEIVSKED